MQHDISLTTGIWHVSRRSSSGEIWAFYGKTLSIRRLGGRPQKASYEYDEAVGTLALGMSDGTRVLWRVVGPEAGQVILCREDETGRPERLRLQRAMRKSPVLMRTIEILLTRRNRIYMEVVPVDLLRAWRISRIRAEQLEALYHDTEAFDADDEHSGLFAFLHAFKLYERDMDKRRSCFRLSMQAAFEDYLYILETWLYLYDRGIVVEGIEPLYVGGYRYFNERLSGRIHNLNAKKKTT